MVTATQSAVLSLELDVDADDDDQAAEFVEEEDEEEESLGGLSGFENLSDAPSAAPLIHPTVMYQPKLDLLEVKALKGQAETLAREKRLLKVQIGNKGLTQTVVASIMDALTANTLVRVKLGEGAGLERGAAALQLAALCDVVVVHQVGFTLTLYRQAGLPRPDNSPRPLSPKDIAAAAAIALAAEQEEEAREARRASAARYALMQGGTMTPAASVVVVKKKSRSKTKAADRKKKLAAIRAALPKMDLPPEFLTV
ncbi:MAG: hypothetical protein WDW38_011294 [Sanguina aurantia]